MLYQVPSSRTLPEIERALHEAAARHRFGVIAVHDLKETLAGKGVPLDQEVRVYEVCNPHQAKKVLDADGAVSTALPCRISVYGKPGAYVLATLRPTELLQGLSRPGLEAVAREVEDVLVAMMQDAAG